MKIKKFCVADPTYWNKVCNATYIPTENCNMRCDYCSRSCNIIKDKYYYASVSDFKRLLEFLELQGYENYTFEFFGGEPSVHSHFKEFHKILIEYFNKGKNLLRIHTLTNLFKPLEYWTCDWPKQTRFSCSCHFDRIKDLDEWFDKVYYLLEKDMLRDIKFIMTPENEKEIVKVYEKYKSDKFHTYEFVVQEQLVGTDWAEKVAKKYDADYLGNYKYEDIGSKNCEIVFEDGSKGKLRDFQFQKFYAAMCNCKFRIAENGDLYYCWRKFNDEKSKPLLNVFKDPLKKVSEWHVCSYSTCDICDIEYPKYSVDYFIRNKNEIQRR